MPYRLLQQNALVFIEQIAFEKVVNKIQAICRGLSVLVV